MSNSTFLDNPLLKVSRPVAACSRCRTAKIKCDGKLPACSACEKAGKAGTCSGASDEFARGKERSYVASLEGYCERLEKRISNLRRRQLAGLTDGAGVIRENSITSVSSPGSLAQSHRREVTDIDDLVGDFGFLSVNATSRDFHGVTSSTSFANLLMSVSVVESLPSRSTEPLPLRHEATPLLQYYFDNIFTQLPFFVETNFWTSVDAVYQSNGRFAKPFDHWALRLVLAIASASISYQHGDKSYRRALSLVVDALQYAEDVLHPGSITGIQAILLLAQYSLFDPRHFHSWYLVGMAVRVMVDLGLHHDLPSEVVTDTDRLDMRRRVFHIIYSLDSKRCVSSVLGRTFSFSDNSVNVALPTSAASTSLGASVTKQSHVFLRSIKPALHLVKIRQILSAGYHDMYYNGREPHPQPLVPIWSLCSRIREWFENCPTDVPNYFTNVYRLEMLYTTVIILSPSHRYPELCDYHKALLLDCCMDYADQLHRALEDPSALPSITFIDIQRVYQVGRRLVELLSHDYDLLLSGLVPVPPPVPPGTPDPPPLRNEDRINCHARSVRCVSHIRDLLQYCSRKWDMDTLLEQFDQASSSIQKRLVQTPMMYFNGPSTYMAEASTTLPPTTSTYSPFDIGQFNP